MTLHNTEWSNAGVFRGGGSVAFSGDNSSFGNAPHCVEFEALQSGITLGMTVHRNARGRGTSRVPRRSQNEPNPIPTCLAVKDNVFSLCLETVPGALGSGNDQQVFVWTVSTTRGPVSCKHALPDTADPSTPVILRVTYNATSATANIFIDGAWALWESLGITNASYTRVMLCQRMSDGLW